MTRPRLTEAELEEVEPELVRLAAGLGREGFDEDVWPRLARLTTAQRAAIAAVVDPLAVGRAAAYPAARSPAACICCRCIGCYNWTITTRTDPRERLMDTQDAVADEDEASAPAAEAYKLTLTGGGMTLDRDVSEDVALGVIGLVMGGPGPDSAGATPRPAPVRPGAQPMVPAVSLREFLDDISAKRNIEKIVGIATYLADHRGQAEFAPGDIKQEFRTAAEPTPANFMRDFRWATNAGWIAETPAGGSYYVTKTGRQAVDAEFSKEVKKASGQNRATRRRRQRPKDADE